MVFKIYTRIDNLVILIAGNYIKHSDVQINKIYFFEKLLFKNKSMKGVFGILQNRSDTGIRNWIWM
jgi:hypothetical protein